MAKIKRPACVILHRFRYIAPWDFCFVFFCFFQIRSSEVNWILDLCFTSFFFCFVTSCVVGCRLLLIWLERKEIPRQSVLHSQIVHHFDYITSSDCTCSATICFAVYHIHSAGLYIYGRLYAEETADYAGATAIQPIFVAIVYFAAPHWVSIQFHFSSSPLIDAHNQHGKMQKKTKQKNKTWRRKKKCLLTHSPPPHLVKKINKKN